MTQKKEGLLIALTQAINSIEEAGKLYRRFPDDESLALESVNLAILHLKKAETFLIK